MLPPHDLQQLIGQRRHQRADELGEGFCRFRELVGKLGSGERTCTGLTQAEASEAFKENLQKGVLFPKRLGDPEQLASMVVECITNSYMNAETIRVDGGIRMPPK